MLSCLVHAGAIEPACLLCNDLGLLIARWQPSVRGMYVNWAAPYPVVPIKRERGQRAGSDMPSALPLSSTKGFSTLDAGDRTQDLSAPIVF